jgi:hypothetical protein
MAQKQLSPEELKEAQKRTEEKIKEIKAQKEKEEKLAPKLSKMLLEGGEYSENMVVKTKRKQDVTVELYALTDIEIFDAMKQMGINSLKELGEMNTSDIKIMKLLGHLALTSINKGEEKWTMEELSKVLPFVEIIKIGNKVLEISGFIPGEVDQKTVEGF